MSSASYSYINNIANISISSDFVIRKTTIFTMPPILKPARRRDGDVTAPELPRTLTTPANNHEGSFVGGRISVVSPVVGTRWRDLAERRLVISGRDRGSGGGGSGGGDSYSLNYGELQCYSPKALLCLKEGCHLLDT